MNIQSNTTSLQAEQTELQSLLESVNALPEASSGGGSVETCTVTINCVEGWRSISATIFDGQIDAYARTEPISASLEVITIENVVCNSVISVYPAIGSVDYEMDGAEHLCAYMSHFFKITAAAGETATITMYSNL